jgi:dTDP-glucose 4,6-dehydratase
MLILREVKKILITGAAGFIGSHLCEFYLKKKHVVFGIDNFLTGTVDNINDILNDKNFTFFKHDVRDKFEFNESLDYILHFASPASPVDYLKNPIKTLQIGSIGTENILELGLKTKATVLVASTSEVYGDPLLHPQNENYYGNVNPIGQRGVYDEAKRYLEALTIAYKNKKKLDVRIVRIFNTYGPKMRINDGRAIPNFINQALFNKDFTIYGNGKQTRSFCYIDDTINGIHKVLKSNYQFPVNIGNPVEFSILELVKTINSLIQSKSRITFKNLPENDPKIRQPDIQLARKKFKWYPVIDLETGLIKTISFYKKLHNLEK